MGGRSDQSGPYLYFDERGKLVRDPRPGRGGSHGPQHEFVVEIRNKNHPITRGMPKNGYMQKMNCMILFVAQQRMLRYWRLHTVIKARGMSR